MKRTRERQCLCCKDIFFPDYRNTKKQAYCQKPECRKASKAGSQRKWTRKNRYYFSGPVHVERVRNWRSANPGRSHRKTSAHVLQDDCSRIPPVDQHVNTPLPPILPAQSSALQDFCLTQHPVIIGLISQLTGCVLQEDIDTITHRLAQLGHDVMASNPITGGIS